MKAKQYAEAFFLATRTKSDAEVDRLTTRFVEILTVRGHRRLLPTIVRELEKLTVQRGSASSVVIRVAREADLARLQETLEADIRTLEATDIPRTVVVDDTLIGGYEIRANGKRIDRTHKRSLLTLYTNLITNNQ